MIPDFKELIPHILKENMNVEGQALVDKLNEYKNDWTKEIILLGRCNNPVLCPVSMLDETGYQLAAGILSSDTERQKRVKIWNAIKGHKKRSLWEDDIKIKIDNITGLDAQLYNVIGDDDSIFVGDNTTPPAFYWASMGCDGIDDDLGEAFIGDGTEVNIAGNIYIDLGGFVSEDILDLIEADISIKNKLLPSYFVIYLGYTTGTTFTILRVI